MSNSTTYQINLQGNAIEILMQMQGQFNQLNNNVEKVNKSLKSVSLQNLKQGLLDLAAPIQEAFKGVEVFDHKIHQLNSVVDINADALAQIRASAIQTSNTFGGSAADSIETYKILLSKLSPEIAKNPEALKAMGDQVAIASKLMDGDGLGAVSALTTAMNQYGVSLENPIQASKEMAKMLDMMQAGAKVGSAELPDLTAGLEEAGATANAANVKFAELNGLLQLMDKGGKRGAEGGVAVRNMLSIMNEGRFMSDTSASALKSMGVSIDLIADKTIPLKDRLKELSKIQGDGAVVSQLFGRENQAAGQFLLNNLSLLDDYISSISNSEGIAKQSATEIMSSYQETALRIGTWFTNLGIQIISPFQGAIPYIESFLDKLQSLAMIYPGLSAVMGIFITAEGGVITANTAGMTSFYALASGVWAFTSALLFNPYTITIAALAGIVVAIKYCWDHFEGFRGFLYGLWATFKQVFANIKAIVFDVMGGIGDMISAIFNKDLNSFTAAFKKFAGGIANTYNPTAFLKGTGDAYQKGEKEGIQNFRNEKAKKEHGGELVTTGAGDTSKLLPMASGDYKLPVITAKSPNGGGGSSAGSSSSSSSSGSGQIRNNNIRIDALMKGDIIFSKSGEGMTAAQVKEMFVKLFTEAVHDTELAIS